MEEYSKLSLEELEALLNDRQKKFVIEMEHDGVAYKAAERAGYSKRTAASQASDLLRNPKVAAYRRARARLLFNALGYDREGLGVKLVEILDRCMDAKPHLSWDSEQKAWTPDGTWVFDSRGAVKAVETMARLQGMYTDKLQLSAQTGGVLILPEAGEIDEPPEENGEEGEDADDTS